MELEPDYLSGIYLFILNVKKTPKIYRWCKSHYQNDPQTVDIFVPFGSTGVTLYQSDKIQGKVRYWQSKDQRRRSAGDI